MTKYQIALFSNGADGRIPILRDTLSLRLGELGIKAGAFSFLDEAEIATRDRKAPTVAAFLSESPSPATRGGIVELVKSGSMVVPVVKDLKRFNSFVFDELRGINGMEFRSDDPEMNRIAAVLMEGLSLLRRSRRLFISYRRSETQGVAIQLYESLDHSGFDVFLDTVSIRPGEPFQDVLWHRLADTDVIVLLDSPGFLASRWTTAELSRANSTNIQVLQLVWPDNKLEANAAFSRAIMLNSSDFEKVMTGAEGRLKEATVQQVVTEAESLRARALAARYTYLVEEFCGEASNLGLNYHVQPQRIVTLESGSGKQFAAVPAVGVPDAVRYQEIEDEVEKHHSEVILLYDERGIREQWLKHLEWLDRQKLRVRSLSVAKAASWLEGLV
jgi:TIR domain